MLLKAPLSKPPLTQPWLILSNGISSYTLVKGQLYTNFICKVELLRSPQQ